MKSYVSRSAAGRRLLLRAKLSVERFEGRDLPSGTMRPPLLYNTPNGPSLTPYPFAGVVGFTPAQVRHAYGFDLARFGTIAGDGTGQSVAIVDAFSNPKFVSTSDPTFASSDLARFDATFGIPDPPSFAIVNQSGGTNLPPADSFWAGEIALDVEWLHALAPKANIVLVETNNNS